MLNGGHPPDDWAELLRQSELETTRLKEIASDI